MLKVLRRSKTGQHQTQLYCLDMINISLVAVVQLWKGRQAVPPVSAKSGGR